MSKFINSLKKLLEDLTVDVICYIKVGDCTTLHMFPESVMNLKPYVIFCDVHLWINELKQSND